MLPYVIIYILMWSIALIATCTKRRNAKFLYILQVAIVFLFCALKFETGYDWPAYKEHYASIANDHSSHYRFEALYEGLAWIFAKTGFTYEAFFAIIIFFVCTTYGLTIWRIFGWIGVIILPTLYSISDYLIIPFFSLNRQMLASALLMLAFSSFLRGRKLQPMILALIATGFHLSAAVMLALYAVFYFIIQNRRLSIFLLAFASISYLVGIDLFGQFLLRFLTLISWKYEIYTSKDTYNASILYRLVYASFNGFIAYLILKLRNNLMPYGEASILNYDKKLVAAAFSSLIIAMLLFGFPTVSSRYQVLTMPLAVGIGFISLHSRIRMHSKNCVLVATGALALFLPFYRFLINPMSIVFFPYQIAFAVDEQTSTGMARTQELLNQLYNLWSQ